MHAHGDHVARVGRGGAHAGRELAHVLGDLHPEGVVVGATAVRARRLGGDATINEVGEAYHASGGLAGGGQADFAEVDFGLLVWLDVDAHALHVGRRGTVGAYRGGREGIGALSRGAARQRLGRLD